MRLKNIKMDNNAQIENLAYRICKSYCNDEKSYCLHKIDHEISKIANEITKTT